MYPAYRTYYEPIAGEGTYLPSLGGSCGYSRTHDQSLIGSLDGATVDVHPEEGSGRLTIHLLFRESYPMQLETSLIEVFYDGSKDAVPPIAVDDRASREIVYVLPAATSPKEVVVQLLPGYLRRGGGRSSELTTFRFRKTSKFDVYYSSINC